MIPWHVREHVKSVYDELEFTLLEPGPALVQAGEKLYAEQGDARRALADSALFLYYASARYGLRGSSLAQALMPTDPPFRNVIGKCVDTKTAHIFRNQVRCYFLTEAGSVADRDKAEGMTQAVEAQFEASGIYGYEGLKVCFNGSLFEGGVVKTVVDFENNRVLNDNVFPWELFFPLEEARSGKPTQGFHRILIDRSRLAGMFPKFSEQIAKAPCAPDDWLMIDGNHEQTSDLVAAWEAWHLPSTHVDLDDPKVWGRDKDGKFTQKVDPGHDGRHAIALCDGESTTLLDRPWVYDHFPLARFLPQPDPIGPWSLSLPEILGAVQLELIKLGKRIQNIINLHGVPRLAVDRRAKVNVGKLTNDTADTIEVNGSPATAITYLQPGSIPADLFRREEELDREAQERAGISEMSMSARKPAGIESGVALQHLSDEESVRHTPAHRAWERFHVELGINNVDAFRELAEHNADFTLMFGDAENLKKIKWTDVDLGRGKYKFRAWPTNLLPSTPGAKKSNVLEMLQGGLFEDTPAAKKARGLLGFPDFQAAAGDEQSLEKNVLRMIDKVETEGMSIDTMPEPYNDPALCMKLAGDRINKLQSDGAEESKVQGLRDFHESARRLSLQMQAETVQANAGVIPGSGGQPPPPMAPPPGMIAA